MRGGSQPPFFQTKGLERVRWGVMMGSKVEILDVMKRLHEASDPLRQVMYTEAECNDDNL